MGLYEVKLSTVAEVGPAHESLFAGSIANTNPFLFLGIWVLLLLALYESVFECVVVLGYFRC